MKLELYQYVSLCRDIPEHNLKRGDVAMLIDYLTHPDGGEDGYILEVFNGAGDSIAVFTVPTSAVEKLPSNVVLAVRPLVGI
ncbi:MAG: DUF4926 domain-containing protein [Nostocales cyanobacterium 94392]|nr:DUF4926 domain-containing protein [Nostocales cyanobacterium 94392]